MAFSGYILFSDNKNREIIKIESDIKQNDDNKENEDEGGLVFSSMQDVLVYNKPLKCSYGDVSDNGAETTGIIYVADDKRRTEYEIVNKEMDEKIENNSINIGEWMYSWNNISTEGIKMNLREMYGDEKFEKYTKGEIDSMKQKINYECRIWIPDNSKFSIPAEIEFKDVKI